MNNFSKVLFINRKSSFINQSSLKRVVALILLLNLFSHRAFAAADVRLFFSPESLTLPPAQTIELVADLGPHQLAFAHIELAFDPALIRVDGQITTTPTLSTVVRKTNPDEANKTGRIVLALALPPGEQEPPTGTVTLAKIPFTSTNNGNANQTTTLRVDPERTKLITRTEQLLSFDTASLTVTAHPALRRPIGCRDALRPRITTLSDLVGWIRAIWRSCL